MRKLQIKIRSGDEHDIVSVEGGEYVKGNSSVLLQIGYLETDHWVGTHLSYNQADKLRAWLAAWLEEQSKQKGKLQFGGLKKLSRK